MNVLKYLDEIKEVQENLLKYLDYDVNNEAAFQILKKFFNDIIIHDDQNKLKALLYLIVRVANNYHRKNDFFNKIDRILKINKDYIKKYFSNWEIFSIFKSNKRILLFLIDEQIMFMDERVVEKIMKDVKFLNANYPDYFAPEIKPFLNDYLLYDAEYLIERINETPENFFDLRKTGENDSFICKLIQNDSIDEFILYINQNNISINTMIPPSIYETNYFLIKSFNIKLIEYAAFYGSIRIFKYLHSNKAQLNRSLMRFAIHGRNPEIIHILEESQIVHENNPYNYYFIESIKCHHNDIADYFLNNYLQNDENYSKYIIDAILKNYNFAFIQNKYINESSFASLVRYDYYILVDILLKNQNIDLNKVTIYTKSYIINDKQIYYSVLHIAAKKNNVKIAKLFLSKPSIDVNIKNDDGKTALYIAVKNNNIEIVQLLLSTPNIIIDVNNIIIQNILILFTKYY